MTVSNINGSLFTILSALNGKTLSSLTAVDGFTILSSPVPTANLVLWLKADTQVYNNAGTTLATNGQTVQQWNDQSGNGYNVSQATSGNRPTFVTAAINSLPAVQLSAARPDGLEVANNSDFNLNTTVSMFGVIKVTSFPAFDYNYIVSKDNNGAAGAVAWAATHNAAGKHMIIERDGGNSALKY